MRVAISALSIKPNRTGGGETTLVHIMRELAREDESFHYLLFVSQENRALFADLGPAVELYVVPQWVNGVARRIAYEMFFMPRAVRRWNADIFFAVNQVSSPLISCAVCSFIQNLLFYSYGELYPRQLHLGAQLRRLFFRLMGRRSVRRARQAIAVSETARQIVMERDGVAQVEVVPLAAEDTSAAVDSAQVDAVRARMRAPYFVYVGALEAYKNVDRIIAALALLRARTGSGKVRLAIIGAGEYEVALRADAKRLHIEDAIEWVGPVAHRDMGPWYAASLGALLLSRCEAFPLVPLEAMAHGVPVVASHHSAIPEVVGDGGIIVDSENAEAVADVLHALATDAEERRAVVDLGRRRVKNFSWQRTACELVAHWRRIGVGIESS